MLSAPLEEPVRGLPFIQGNIEPCRAADENVLFHEIENVRAGRSFLYPNPNSLLHVYFKTFGLKVSKKNKSNDRNPEVFTVSPIIFLGKLTHG